VVAGTFASDERRTIVSPVFRHGGLRLYLLKLLDEAPRHGYEVIRLLQDRFMGVYAPSPGTIYPRLARLEEEGLINVIPDPGDRRRRQVSLTEAGSERWKELERRSERRCVEKRHYRLLEASSARRQREIVLEVLVVGRNRHHPDHRAAGTLVRLDQLPHKRRLAEDHVVAPQHGERLVAHDLLGE